LFFFLFSVSGTQPDTSPFSRAGMAKAMWTVQENNDTLENNETIDSVPIPANSNFSIPGPFRDYNPLRVINNVTGTAVSLKRIQARYERMNESLLESNLTAKDVKQAAPARAPLAETIKTLNSRYGVYIPMLKLNRVKRQIVNEVNKTSTNQRGRILMLMNPNDTTIDQAMFKKSVLMLVRQPEEPKVKNNSLSKIPNLLSIDNHSSVQELLQAYKFKPLVQSVELREVLERQPAIQRVNLASIELAIADGTAVPNISDTAVSSTQNSTDVQQQIKRLLEILVAQTRPNTPVPPSLIGPKVRSPSIRQPTAMPSAQTVLNNQRSSSSSSSSNRASSVRQETLRNNTRGNRLVNFRHSGRSGGTGNNVLTILPTSRPSARVVARSQITNVRPPVRRQQGGNLQRGATTGAARGRGPVRPSLARQAPVNTRRIPAAGTGRQRTGTPPRRLRPLVQTISSRNLRQQPIGRRGNRPTGPNPRRTPVRRPVRRQFIQRRRSPFDPFTQRFAAGFQRGSSLLHQPPLNVTSFDGNVRDQPNGGFTPFNPFNSPFNPGPNLGGMTGVPPVFGAGMPNMFLGPSIL